MALTRRPGDEDVLIPFAARNAACTGTTRDDAPSSRIGECTAGDQLMKPLDRLHGCTEGYRLSASGAYPAACSQSCHQPIACSL